jgi:hypothetical protein
MIIPDVIHEYAKQLELSELEEYVARVWKLLGAMKPGDVLIIEKLCKPDTKDLFLESIKFYMRSHEWQDGLSFSQGFKELRKYELVFNRRRAGSTK